MLFVSALRDGEAKGYGHMKALSVIKNMNMASKAAVWFVICGILQKAFSFLTTPLFTRMLTATEYGMYSAYLSWLNIFTIIITFRLEAGVFNKGMAKFPEMRDVYTSSMQGLSTVLLLGAFVIYLLFSKSIQMIVELPQQIILLMFLEIGFLPAYNFWTRRKRYEFQYRQIVAVTLLLALLNPILGVLFIKLFSGNRGIARIISAVLAQSAVGAVLYIYNLKKGKCFYHSMYWKYAIRFNLPLIPHYISLYILQHSDRVMIQKICGFEAVALYSVIYNYSVVLNTVLESLNHAIVPWLYQALENGAFGHIKKKINKLFGWLAAMLLVFTSVSPELCDRLYPPRYYDAVNLVPMISGSLLLIFLYTMMANIEFYYEHRKATMVISVCGAGLNIALNAVCIPFFGYKAAAATTLICYVAFFASHSLYLYWLERSEIRASVVGWKAVWSVLFTYAVAVVALTIIRNAALRYGIVALVVGLLWMRRKWEQQIETEVEG